MHQISLSIQQVHQRGAKAEDKEEGLCPEGPWRGLLLGYKISPKVNSLKQFIMRAPGSRQLGSAGTSCLGSHIAAITGQVDLESRIISCFLVLG